MVVRKKTQERGPRRFSVIAQRLTKREAQRRARGIRNRGNLARVERRKDGFVLLEGTARDRARFIARAIKKPGALTDTVRRRFGADGFTTSVRTGRPIIKPGVLRQLAREGGVTGRRARFAMNLRRLRMR